jgi:hypothetical protein
MKTNDDFGPIASLDLNTVKKKLMHRPSGAGWSQEKTDAVEVEYRRFLYLMKLFPHEQTSPTRDVDTFWHHHILDTVKYAADCDTVFGYFLHHYPYVGMEGAPDDAEVRQRCAERMRELYQQVFGAPCSGTTAYCGMPCTSAYCGAATKARSDLVATVGQTAYCGASAARATYGGASTAQEAIHAPPWSGTLRKAA